METQQQTSITTNTDDKQIIVTRTFDAPLAAVWRAWTSSDLLDRWWAPKPWVARTTSMDFNEGGEWLYAMVGPDGTEIFAKVTYQEIQPESGFTAVDAFCDAAGNLNEEMSRTNWNCRFTEAAGSTEVHIELTFDSVEDKQKILDMGFAEGFTSAHSNLDDLLLEN